MLLFLLYLKSGVLHDRCQSTLFDYFLIFLSRFFQMVIDPYLSFFDFFLSAIDDTSTMQNAVTELDREKLDIGNGRITGMEVLERNQYVFHILEYEQEAGGMEAFP